MLRMLLTLLLTLQLALAPLASAMHANPQIGASGFVNSRQLHRDEAQWIRGDAAKLAQEPAIAVEQAQAMLIAGIGILGQLRDLGSDTLAAGLAFRRIDPTGHMTIQNAATGIENQLMIGYLGGDHQGAVFGGNTDPTKAGFDVFNYYADANLKGYGPAAAGVGWSKGAAGGAAWKEIDLSALKQFNSLPDLQAKRQASVKDESGAVGLPGGNTGPRLTVGIGGLPSGYTRNVGGGEKSYLNGVEVPNGTPGSVRPDAVLGCGTQCFEVKNYDLSSTSGQNRLVTATVKQINQRATQLPAGMQQEIKIDITGQNVSAATRLDIKNRIVQGSNGAVDPGSIDFFTRP